MGFRARTSEENNRITVFAQRNVWNRLGAYAVHVALLTIFTGGFLTSHYGVGGSMEIRPGKTSDQFFTIEQSLENVGEPRQGTAILPFKIECRDIQQKLIRPEGGLEAQNTIDWLSYITIIDKDTRKDMLVHLNNVGDYRGYRFFQSQFMPIGNARKITVAFEPVNGGSPIIAQDIPRNGSVDVPGIGNVRYVEFFADFEITESGFTTVSRDYNKPVAQLEITGVNGQKQVALALGSQAAEELLGKANEKSEKQGVDNKLLVNGNKVLLKDFEKVSYTHTLTVQYDPGRTPVYIGFALLVLSLCSVFFFSHQRVWAVIEPNGKGTKVYFGGNTNRNRPAFEGRFNSLVQSVTGGGSKDE
jgi:cytochrome c biogenesis protein